MGSAQSAPHACVAAVQIAVETSAVPTLIPHIKDEGGTDIVVTTIRMLTA